MLLHGIKLENSVSTRICSRDPWQHMLAKQWQLESVVSNLPLMDSLQWRLQVISTFSQLFYFENMPLLPTQAVPHMWAMVKTTLRGTAICRPWATTIATVASAGDFLHMVVPAKPPYLLWKRPPPHLCSPGLKQEAGKLHCMELLHILYRAF
jgi:hypothetical protein